MDSNGVANIDIALPDATTTNGYYIFVSELYTQPNRSMCFRYFSNHLTNTFFIQVQFLEFNDNVGYYSKVTPEISTDTNSIKARLITKK